MKESRSTASAVQTDSDHRHEWQGLFNYLHLVSGLPHHHHRHNGKLLVKITVRLNWGGEVFACGCAFSANGAFDLMTLAETHGGVE